MDRISYEQWETANAALPEHIPRGLVVYLLVMSNLHSWWCPIQDCNSVYGTRSHWTRHFSTIHPNSDIKEFKERDEATNLAKLMAEGLRASNTSRVSKARKPRRRRKPTATSTYPDSPTEAATPATSTTATTTTTTTTTPRTIRGSFGHQSSPSVATSGRQTPRSATLHYGQPPRERHGIYHNPAQSFIGNVPNTAPAAGFGPNLTVPGQRQNATGYENGAGQYANSVATAQRGRHVGGLLQAQTGSRYPTYAQGGMGAQAIDQGYSLHDNSFHDNSFHDNSFHDNSFHDNSFHDTSFHDTSSRDDSYPSTRSYDNSFRGPGSRGPSSQGPSLQPAPSRGQSLRGHAETLPTGQVQSFDGLHSHRHAAWGQATCTTGQVPFFVDTFSYNSSIQAHSGNQGSGQGHSLHAPFLSGYSAQNNTSEDGFTINGLPPASAAGLNDDDDDDIYSSQD